MITARTAEPQPYTCRSCAASCFYLTNDSDILATIDVSIEETESTEAADEPTWRFLEGLPDWYAIPAHVGLIMAIAIILAIAHWLTH